jgi:hypothetical protein
MRKLNCAVGDLAIVVEAFNPSNIGSIVRVISRHKNQNCIEKPQDDLIWLVYAPNYLIYSSSEKLTLRKKGGAPDSCLRPIRGIPPKKEIAFDDTTKHQFANLIGPVT